MAASGICNFRFAIISDSCRLITILPTTRRECPSESFWFRENATGPKAALFLPRERRRTQRLCYVLILPLARVAEWQTLRT